MKRTHVIICVVLAQLLACIILSDVCGQSLSPTVLSTGGNYFQTPSNSLSFTIGEVAITTLEASNNTLTQGFQQPFVVMVSNEESIPTDIKVNVFPNPFKENIQIHIGTLDKDVEVRLFNLLGVQLPVPISGENQSGQQKFEIQGAELPQGVYFVRIYLDHLTDPMTYKVIKLQ